MNREEELAESVRGEQERRGEAIMERWWNRWEKAKVNEGRRMEGEDSSPLRCRCSWAFSCAAAILHLNSIFFQLFHNNNNNNNNNINNNDHDNAKKIYINPCYVSQLQVHKKGGGEALPSSSSES